MNMLYSSPMNQVVFYFAKTKLVPFPHQSILVYTKFRDI